MEETKNNRIPEQIKTLSAAELGELAAYLRDTLIQTTAKNGGHLASNLGVVELTLALHRVFDLPGDKIVFDVGHQAYVHKMLTGRAERIGTIRKKDGLSGFPKTSESPCDAFNTGHSSTSISAALGLLRAARLQGDFTSHVVALIGDGALTGGMAFEALNDAGESELPLVVVLNDNDMSISANVGALNRHLNALRSSRGYQRFKRRTETFLSRIPGVGTWLAARLSGLRDRIKYFMLPHNVFFEEMGFKYWGPVDGHDVAQLTEVLTRARDAERPVLIHAITKKGKGYLPAERDPESFHSAPPFDPATGVPLAPGAHGNSAVFGEALCTAAETDARVAVVCAAMPVGTGMKGFAARYPERFFDVGIAEEHAVTMAAGLAAGGMRPVVAVYSTFLQRAYDQVLHDVCLQRLPVVFGVDRAGLVGEDGETHQGIYDISYLLSMPYIQVWSPSSQAQLRRMAGLALAQDGPVAIRYGRGALPAGEDAALEAGKWAVLQPVRPVTVLAAGRMLAPAREAAAELDVGLADACFLRPMDTALLATLGRECTHVITVEDGIRDGGFGLRVAAALCGSVRVSRLGVPETPVTHASLTEQDAACAMTAEAIRCEILRCMEEKA